MKLHQRGVRFRVSGVSHAHGVIGRSSLSSSLFDQTGRVLGQRQRSYRTHRIFDHGSVFALWLQFSLFELRRDKTPRKEGHGIAHGARRRVGLSVKLREVPW